MYFLDDTHLDEFLKLISTYRKERSKEYVAAYYLLTSEKDIRQKVQNLILPPQGVIDWSAILLKKVKRERQIIIRLAFDLFNDFKASDEMDPNEVINKLDEKTHLLMAQAIDIRKNWPRCSYIGKTN